MRMKMKRLSKEDVWGQEGSVFPYTKCISLPLCAVWQGSGCWLQTQRRLILMSAATPDGATWSNALATPSTPPHLTLYFFPVTSGQSVITDKKRPLCRAACAKPTDPLAGLLSSDDTPASCWLNDVWTRPLSPVAAVAASPEVLLLFVLRPHALPWASGHAHLYAAPCPTVPLFQTSLAACCCLHNYRASRWTTRALKVTLIRRNRWKHVGLLAYPVAFWLYGGLFDLELLFQL